MIAPKPIQPGEPVKIFVAGGSGVIGRALVPMLVAAGHTVAATTRTPGRAAQIQAMGATPVVVDGLDEPAVQNAVAAFRPSVLMHQMTALPPVLDPRRAAPRYRQTARLRLEGTRILLRAGGEAGAHRFVMQSIAFMYAPRGPMVVSEEAPLATDSPEPIGELIRATTEGEQLSLSAEGMMGVVLRYGQLYGPGTYYAAGGALAVLAARRRLPVVGGGHGVSSFLHVDDAAGAALAAVERGGGIYNVTDDEPAPGHQWIPAFCRELGAPPPMRLPGWVVRIAAGPGAVSALVEGRGASNARAKAELGWEPRRPTWRTGFLVP